MFKRKRKAAPVCKCGATMQEASTFQADGGYHTWWECPRCRKQEAK